jgi:hypothetical protein
VLSSTRSRTIALVTVAAVPSVAEAIFVAAIGFQAARALPAQAGALWPYQSYHDMRWILVYHNSIPGFLGEFVVIVAARGLSAGGLVALAWPAEVSRPRLRWLAMRNLRVAALAAVVILPWAVLAVGFAAVPLIWILLASLVPTLLLSPFLIRAGIVRDWWRGLPTAELVGWSLLDLAILTVAGALAASLPIWWGVPVAAVAGATNGLLRKQVVHEALAPRRIRWARIPVAPLAIAFTLVASVAVQGLVGQAAGGPGHWRPPILSERLPPKVRHAVIAIAGHDSFYDGQPATDPLVERFSYSGLDAQNRPRPYDYRASHQSLESSARLLSAQVDTIHRRTGRPVALIGQSEGALVARTYLELRPRSPVDTVLLFSPLVEPGRAYIPPQQSLTGWGVVVGWGLRAFYGASNLAKSTKDSPDEPFVRSILDNAPFYRNRMLCPVPGIRMVAFLPTSTAAEAPPDEHSRIPVFQMPAFHGGLLSAKVVEDHIVDLLAGQPATKSAREYGLLQRLGAPWQPPPLALSVNPAWRGSGQGDPAFTGRICEPA